MPDPNIVSLVHALQERGRVYRDALDLHRDIVRPALMELHTGTAWEYSLDWWQLGRRGGQG